MALKMDVGPVLREARINAGFTQEHLARILGIPNYTLNRVEHGVRSFDLSWLEKLPEQVRVPVANAVHAQCSQIMDLAAACGQVEVGLDEVPPPIEEGAVPPPQFASLRFRASR